MRAGGNGDGACDPSHRLAEDASLIAGLGAHAYRFSISWPRVQPRGEGAWNEKGFAFYDRLIDRLLERGIAPHLTLYHWDLPQALQEKGGWLSRDTTARCVEYAPEVGRPFGDREASIATQHAPWVVATRSRRAGGGARCPGQEVSVANDEVRSAWYQGSTSSGGIGRERK